MKFTVYRNTYGELEFVDSQYVKSDWHIARGDFIGEIELPIESKHLVKKFVRADFMRYALERRLENIKANDENVSLRLTNQRLEAEVEFHMREAFIAGVEYSDNNPREADSIGIDKVADDYIEEFRDGKFLPFPNLESQKGEK